MVFSSLIYLKVFYSKRSAEVIFYSYFWKIFNYYYQKVLNTQCKSEFSLIHERFSLSFSLSLLFWMIILLIFRMFFRSVVKIKLIPWNKRFAEIFCWKLRSLFFLNYYGCFLRTFVSVINYVSKIALCVFKSETTLRIYYMSSLISTFIWFFFLWKYELK